MLSFFCKQKISEELERRLSHGLKVFAAAAAIVVVDAAVAIVVVVDAAIAIVVVVDAAVVVVVAVVADDLWIIFCLCV